MPLCPDGDDVLVGAKLWPIVCELASRHRRTSGGKNRDGRVVPSANPTATGSVTTTTLIYIASFVVPAIRRVDDFGWRMSLDRELDLR
jgi:hypothetical protein